MAIEFNAYCDFDAFSKDVRHIDSCMLLKDPTRALWTNRHIELCGIYVQIGSSGSGNIVEGKSSSKGYLVYMPLNQYSEHAVNGLVLDEYSILFLKPGSDFCLSVKGPHEWCSIFVPMQNLAEYGNQQHSLTVDERPGCGVVHVTPDIAHQVRSFIHDTESAACSKLKFELTPAAAIAAEEAVTLVVSFIVEGRAAGRARNRRSLISRQEIIRRCKGMHEEAGGRRVKVADMAAGVGVSERTLETVFREYFGVGAARYFQLRRFRQINIALHDAQANWETVAEILGRHGEWQSGRFAGRYRRLYGESPSQTLRRQQH